VGEALDQNGQVADRPDQDDPDQSNGIVGDQNGHPVREDRDRGRSPRSRDGLSRRRDNRSRQRHRQSTTNITKIYHPCLVARMKTRCISSATQKTKLTKRQLEVSAPATGRRVVWTSNERETLVTMPPKIRVDNTLTTVVVTDTRRCLMKTSNERWMN